MDLVRLELISVKVTDTHEGESLARYPLRDSDVGAVDRRYNSARALIECADRGVAVVVRYKPVRCGGGQDQLTGRTVGNGGDWAVSAGAGQERVHCRLSACGGRLPPTRAAAARQWVQAQARKKGWRTRPDPGFGRVGVGLERPASSSVTDRDRAGTLSGPMASGTSHQALEKYRPYRPSPRPWAAHWPPWQVLYAWVLEP